MFGIELDAVTMAEAVEAICGWLDEPAFQCKYVVTPNLDHLVLLERSERLRAAYREAALVVADGWPLVAASRLLRATLPERVNGTNLVMNILDSRSTATPLTKVFLLGARPGVASTAAAKIREKWPALQVTGTHSPPLGFENDPAESRRIIEMIQSLGPDLLIVGLGAPKQETWIHEHRAALHTKVALCVGATIDFLAGSIPRAPRWMQRAGLEWLHRLRTEPARLGPRYLRDAMAAPRLLVAELLRRSH